MEKEKLLEDLFNKVPEGSKIAIFGAGPTGEKIKNDFEKIKPNVNVIAFIDNIVEGTFLNLPIWRLKKAVDMKDSYDLVVMSTTNSEIQIINILDIYDIPVVQQTKFVSDYYRRNFEILNQENYNKVLNIFDKQEDKNLFSMIFKARKNIIDKNVITKYYYDNISKYDINFAVKKHYLDKINQKAVKTIFDIGLNDGINVIASTRCLPNLEKVYGFEVIYDYAKKSYIEDFILNEKLEIVPLALGDSNKKLKFFIDKSHLGGSYAEEITSNKEPHDLSNWEIRIVDVTTIDDFCKERQIAPDLIKMDIEGAEFSALKGGISTIKKYRPQLAISIYHSNKDFINIPLYLKENLENYKFKLGHYSPELCETVLYAIPNELS